MSQGKNLIIEIPVEIIGDATLTPAVKILVGIKYSLVVHEGRDEDTVSDIEFKTIFAALISQYQSAAQILSLAGKGEVLTVEIEAVEAVRALNV
ncbi:MAG: hypothetical protein ACREOP_15530 [Thermodesulfobacteriota bacterium]